MKRVTLLHNPQAGDEDHFKADLMKAIEKEGYQCTYFSIKKDEQWKEHLHDVNFVVVAGGDGTVRRVVNELFQNDNVEEKITMALLPMGTANNLSKTFSIYKETSFEDHVNAWKNGKKQRFDMGILKYDDSADFFMESAGCGVFPTLIQTMDKIDMSDLESTDEQLQLALEKLHEIILTAEAHHYTIHVDNKTYEGKYLLLEVMNIPSIGPNLMLAPAAQVGDGYLDIVLISEKERGVFALHVSRIMHQEKTSFDFQTLRATNLEIQSTNKNIHIDDKYITTSNGSLTIGIREHGLDFLI